MDAPSLRSALVPVGVPALGLAAWGLLLDQGARLDQLALWTGLMMASGGGASLALAAGLGRTGSRGERWALVAAVLLGWRVAYFPIMVFSGHVASIGEWLLAATGAPIVVYPTFLLAVFALHGVAGLAATWIVAPPWRGARAVLVPAFGVAALVSFNQPGDLHPLPDTVTSIEPAEVPPPRAAAGNPYLPALFGEGYLPNQRVVLVAAGLTYDTIPPSPWATTVKAVLEGLFHEKPFGSTRDRVREHYLAYHSAHPRIGCRDLAQCPAQAPRPPRPPRRTADPGAAGS